MDDRISITAILISIGVFILLAGLFFRFVFAM